MWNIEGIIFVIIALYILFSVFSYSRRQSLRFYEVGEGSLVREKQYTGLIVRDEKSSSAKDSGYVHFSVADGGRVSQGGDLYFRTLQAAFKTISLPGCIPFREVFKTLSYLIRKREKIRYKRLFPS